MFGTVSDLSRKEELLQLSTKICHKSTAAACGTCYGSGCGRPFHQFGME